MGKRISADIRKFVFCIESSPTIPSALMGVDVREEYANAFRTESYLDFWTRVVAISNGDSAKSKPVESTSATRLPSYRLFAEHLLDPNQPMVTQLLTMTRNHPTTHILLSDYFTQTADASILCGLLLRDINRTRVKYCSFKTTLQSLNDWCTHETLTRLTKFTTTLSLIHIQAIQAGCSSLLKRLESTRNKARAKLRVAYKFRTSSAIWLVAVTASLSVIVVTHALAIVVAMPAFIAASIDLALPKRLVRMTAQLDAATKGTYILNRDLETVSRLVTRLNDDLEHMRGMVRFWVDHREEDWSQASGEVARQLKKNDCRFSEQLDELEEHLYLFFMTINGAKNLVVKEILDPGQSTKTKNTL